MTKYLTWIGLGLFVIWLAKASGVLAAILVFFLAGIVPVVDISIPPVPMLILLAIGLISVFIWVRQQKLPHQIRALKAKHSAATAKQQIAITVTRQKKRPGRPAKRQSSLRRARRSQPKAVTR